MNIGLSLPPDYLGHDQTMGAAATAWYNAFGNASSCLQEMSKAGVTSIELRSVSRDADPDLALGAAHRLWDAELGLTLHGSLPKGAGCETLAGIYPSLVPLARALAERGCDSVITLHCHSGVGDVEELADRTVRSLRRMSAILQAEGVPLRIALEINHIGAPSDPGVTYAGLLDMITRADSPRIGACWDFGHAFMNVQHGRLERQPGTEFLAKVIHTHVHDLGPRTHFPLTIGVVPLDLFLDLLNAQGYSGILNLELSPQRFQGPVKELVHASIERLIEYDRRRRCS